MIWFEWDDGEAAANLARHGVSFDFAVAAFHDRNAAAWRDGASEEADEDDEDDDDSAERRIVMLGMAGDVVLAVIYVELDGIPGIADAGIRMISARKATSYEQEAYFDRIGA